MKRSLLFLALAGLFAASCSREALTEPEPAGEYLEFTASFPDTRAHLEPGYKVSWDKGDRISVLTRDGENFNDLFTASSSGTSTLLSGTGHVPSNGRYYAVYPYDADIDLSGGVTSPILTVPAAQTLVGGSFPSIISVACLTEGTTFIFRHAVGLVEFDLVTEGVRKIIFGGNADEVVAGRVKIEISSKGDEPVVTMMDGSTSIVLTNEGEVIPPGKYYFPVAPMTFARGVHFILEGDGGKADRYTTAPVSVQRSRRLVAGRLDMPLTGAPDSGFSLTYVIDGVENTIYPGNSASLLMTYSGGRYVSYSVVSDAPVAVSYVVNGVPQTGLPEMFAAPVSSAGGILEIAPVQPSGGSNSNVEALKGASPKGTQDSPVDLASDNSSIFGLSGVNTANCYVVRAPGWYGFPLVYGNAIKGGAPNPSAWQPSASGTLSLKNFLRHDGSAITGPYINGGGTVAVSARLEWQDVPGLIDKVSLVSAGGSGDRIVFRVPQENIREGNAVLSALDASGKVVWSWHVWVSGAPAGDFSSVTVTNATGETYEMLRMNVGWVAPYDTPLLYPSRSAVVRFTQEGSGKVIDLPVVQIGQALPANVTGNSPFYQWGRKDPFASTPGVVSDTANGAIQKKTWYTSEGRDTIGTRWAVLGDAIGEFITHPHVYNVSSNMDNAYVNLWSGEQSAYCTAQKSAVGNAKPVKTVYDPSPAGCVVAPVGAFSGFTVDNADEFDKGYWFYSGPGKTGEKIFLPALGRFNTSNPSSSVKGSLINTGISTEYWSATGGSMTRSGWSMSRTASNGALNYSASYKQYTQPVRPVKE